MPRRAASTYASVSRQYLPGVAVVVALFVGVAAARRASGVEVHGLVGDLIWGAVLGVIAVAIIGVAIVRPFERRMHERRRVSAAREHAYRSETERREFERRVASGLELCENEPDLLVTTRRAMQDAAPDAVSELLLAPADDSTFVRAACTDTPPPGCGVDGPSSCPATRRGAPQRFADSEDLDACPWLRHRSQGRIGAVCVPVSITGRALGVVHTVHTVGDDPSVATVEQLTAVADHVGARIGVLRLTAALAPGSDLVQRAGEGGATADGPTQQGRAVTGAQAARLPGDHEIPGVGATATAQGPDGGPDGTVEGDLLGRIE
jgi:hypothetical protein